MQLFDEVSLKITSLGKSGEGVGKLDGYTLFVEGALPGESVTARLVEQKARYGVGKLERVNFPSPDRVTPVCPHFGVCGGCQLMHLSYSGQLEAKRQQVIDALERIGKLTAEVLPCLPSPKETHYRNKIQLPIQRREEGLVLGLYQRSSHQLVPIEECAIHAELGGLVYREIAPLIRAFQGEGLRHLLIRTSRHFEETLVILVTKEGESSCLKALAEEILKRAPWVKGVVQNEHAGPVNVILGPTYRLLAGVPFIQEKIGDLLFRVSPASFFQVNPFQAEALYAKALEWAGLEGDERVLDAYCGVGTLSLIFAPHVREVIGVESVSEAIKDAKSNAEMNGIGNARFFCARAEEFIQRQSSIDLILMNPPRKGCDPRFLEAVGKLRPKKVLYISCDPATLARDLKELSCLGYKTEKLQPFDMFPQTAHVETLAIASFCS
ncbi:MAG: 23S rRNA (uracil(1939)-C(5))-methyltransferase RlmD [Verrucomicrobiota bacterium]|nr:23S rRNA (uracil(1939)-C(5))-methyltransferase RlmD [Verrucomicrobiota bacterium]